MNTPCTVERSPAFDRDLRQLSKKHRKLPTDVADKLALLAQLPDAEGTRIPGLNGYRVYKVRLASCGFGKSGGFRMIYYRAERLLLALFIYFKGEQSDVMLSEITAALKAAGIRPFDAGYQPPDHAARSTDS